MRQRILTVTFSWIKLISLHWKIPVISVNQIKLKVMSPKGIYFPHTKIAIIQIILKTMTGCSHFNKLLHSIEVIGRQYTTEGSWRHHKKKWQKCLKRWVLLYECSQDSCLMCQLFRIIPKLWFLVLWTVRFINNAYRKRLISRLSLLYKWTICFKLIFGFNKRNWKNLRLLLRFMKECLI